MKRSGGLWAPAIAAICSTLALWALAHGQPAPLMVAASAPAHGTFSGKFELVPLFDAGHRPVISNGHQEYAERNTWTFTRPNGERVTIRAGRVTDLASIPAVVWPWLPPDGPYAQAAATHDECYKSRGFRPADRTAAAPYDYHGCNQILREGMVALGTPVWKRVVIFDAVEMFGRSAFGS